MGAAFTLAGPGAVAFALLGPNGLLTDDLALFTVAAAAGSAAAFGLFLEVGVVDEFFLHGGRHHHDLVVTALAGFDQLADADLAGETVFLALAVALHQVVERTDACGVAAAGRAHGLDEGQIAVPIDVLEDLFDDRHARRELGLGRSLGQAVASPNLDFTAQPGLPVGGEPGGLELLQ